MNTWYKDIEATIKNQNLIEEGETFVIGVSGGVDSMVLLTAITKLAEIHNWKPIIAHFNHNLRGEESDGDALLVERTTETLHHTFVMGSGDVKKTAKEQGTSEEMAARYLRHNFLSNTAIKFNTTKIITAHHGDDQTELFFIRLFRGTVSGLAGMPYKGKSPINPTIEIVRPLLHTKKEDLYNIAKQENIPFREDRTNKSDDILRNKIRNNLLPLIKSQYQPAFDSIISRTMETQRDTNNFVQQTATTWLNNKTTKFDDLHPAVQREAIVIHLQTLGIPPAFELIEHLRTHKNKPWNINDKKEIIHTDTDFIKLKTKEPSMFNTNQTTVDLNQNPQVTLSNKQLIYNIDKTKPQKIEGLETADLEKTGTNFILRHWQKGDKFKLLGCTFEKKLQDIFTNKKIDISERHYRLVAETKDNQIFWVEGLPISEKYKVTEETKIFLTLGASRPSRKKQ